jgi:hypothetical protein
MMFLNMFYFNIVLYAILIVLISYFFTVTLDNKEGFNGDDSSDKAENFMEDHCGINKNDDKTDYESMTREEVIDIVIERDLAAEKKAKTLRKSELIELIRGKPDTQLVVMLKMAYCISKNVAAYVIKVPYRMYKNGILGVKDIVLMFKDSLDPLFELYINLLIMGWEFVKKMFFKMLDILKKGFEIAGNTPKYMKQMANMVNNMTQRMISYIDNPFDLIIKAWNWYMNTLFPKNENKSKRAMF